MTNFQIFFQNYLIKDGHYSSQGAALKTTTGWGVDDNGNDDYGFAFLPTGSRSADRGGIFGSLVKHNLAKTIAPPSSKSISW